MRSSIKAGWIIIAGLGIVWAGVQWEMTRIHRRLSAEVAALRKQAAEAAKLREENDRLHASIGELEKRRLALLQLQTERKKAAAQATEGLDASWEPAAGFARMTDLRNVGAATLRNLVESYSWALMHQDAATLGKLLFFDPAGRAKIQTAFAALPEEERRDSSSAEEFFAQIYSAQQAPPAYAGMRVVTGEPAADAKLSEVNTQREFEDGRIRDGSVLPAVRTADGWKMFVYPPLVDQVLRKYSRSDSVSSNPSGAGQ